jgi:hypothetical protein
VFGAITATPALLAAAWLLPALPLLLAHRFTVLPMIFIFVPLAACLCYLGLRRRPGSWPLPSTPTEAREPAEAKEPAAVGEAGEAGEAKESATAGETREAGQAQSARGAQGAQAGRGVRQTQAVPWWAVAGTVAVAVVFAAWQVWMRTEQIIVIRDPATYLQVGYWIAHHGSLPVPQSLAAFGDVKGLSFASMAYFPRGTGIVPQFMTGYPVVVAAAVWLGGIPAALVLTPIVGGFAILSFGGLAGRLAGPRWAPAAAAVLALTLPQQYTARTTFSEPLAEVLLFGGLSLLADALVTHRAGRTAGASLAGLAGLTLGLTIFVRLDGLSDILPVVPFLGVLLAANHHGARLRQAIPFGIGLVIGVGYGLADGYLLSRPYLELEEPSLHPLALITAAVVVVTVAAVVAASRPRVRAALKRHQAKAVRWLPDAAIVLIVLVFIGFAIRPLVQTVNGETDPVSIAYVAELQKLAHLPVNGKDQYYQDSLYWVFWYIGLPAVLLGALGLAILARRGVRALLTWEDPEGIMRIWALPLMIALWVFVTVLWRPAVSPDQPWASRRLVPFVLPGLILGAIWASTWLKQRATRQRPTRQRPTRQRPTRPRPSLVPAATAWCCVAALAIPTAWTTFGISLSPRPTAHGMAFKRIGKGERQAVLKLCERVGDGASVVILDQLTADRFAQVTRGMCGQPTAILARPTATEVTAVVAGIERAGRRPVLLAEFEAELTPYGGGAPREIVNLLTTQEAHVLTAPPTRTWGIHYTVWMSQPG